MPIFYRFEDQTLIPLSPDIEAPVFEQIKAVSDIMVRQDFVPIADGSEIIARFLQFHNGASDHDLVWNGLFFGKRVDEDIHMIGLVCVKDFNVLADWRLFKYPVSCDPETGAVQIDTQTIPQHLSVPHMLTKIGSQDLAAFMDDLPRLTPGQAADKPQYKM